MTKDMNIYFLPHVPEDECIVSSLSSSVRSEECLGIIVIMFGHNYHQLQQEVNG